MESKKEIVELIEGLKLLAMDGKEVMADGKVDMKDLAVITKIVAQREALLKAFTGLGNIKKEEIGSAEAIELLGALIAAAREVAA